MFDLNDAGPQAVPGGLSERRKHSGPGPVTAILKLMSGRQNEILAALGITPLKRGHTRCSTPEHDDRNPSFRWDGEKFYCTCGSGDILDLIVRMGRAHDASSAASWAKEVLGVHVVKPAPSRQPAPRRDPKFDIESILSGCKPLAGTEGETYLTGRGLNDPASPDLLFHPDLTDFETRRGYCGMVAIVRHGAGEPTGGIHRTFLTDDGTGKAAPGKKMLGPVAGGSRRSLSCRYLRVFPAGLRFPRIMSAAGNGRQASRMSPCIVTPAKPERKQRQCSPGDSARLASVAGSWRHFGVTISTMIFGVKPSDYEAVEVGEVATPSNAEPKRKRHRPAKKKTEPETPREPEQIKHRLDGNRIDGDRRSASGGGLIRIAKRAAHRVGWHERPGFDHSRTWYRPSGYIRGGGRTASICFRPNLTSMWRPSRRFARRSVGLDTSAAPASAYGIRPAELG